MTSFPQLATRLFNTPLAILPGKAEIVMAALSDRLGITSVARLNGQFIAMEDADEEALYGSPRSRSQERDVGYDVVAGVAVIGVRGTLVQRNGTLRPYSGMTGYDGIRQNYVMALADSSVDAIVLDIDSPGGEVAGCFDLVDTIHSGRGRKPVWSILGENAYSAAYAIASAADRITVPRTGGTGSVGVIYMHVSFEDALKKAGIDVTLITKGDLKGEGSDMKNLTEDAFKRMKADVEAVGDLFDATVARNRGMKQKAVFDTQAGTFLGQQGVDIGFADAVMSPDQAFRALLAELD
jgi:signal peptide peptidase SppA